MTNILEHNPDCDVPSESTEKKFSNRCRAVASHLLALGGGGESSHPHCVLGTEAEKVQRIGQNFKETREIFLTAADLLECLEQAQRSGKPQGIVCEKERVLLASRVTDARRLIPVLKDALRLMHPDALDIFSVSPQDFPQIAANTLRDALSHLRQHRKDFATGEHQSGLAF